MGMWILALIGVVLSMGVISRRVWLGFHRVVGITPGTLRYIPESDLPKLQLELEEDLVVGLPSEWLDQLKRIDTLEQALISPKQVPTRPTLQTQPASNLQADEQLLIAHKLLKEQLPDALMHYQSFFKAYQAEQTGRSPSLGAKQAPQTLALQATPPDSADADEVKATVQALLDRIEAEFTELVHLQMQSHQRALAITQRYLQLRD